jgi:hypothetical protein
MASKPGFMKLLTELAAILALLFLGWMLLLGSSAPRHCVRGRVLQRVGKFGIDQVYVCDAWRTDEHESAQ